MPRITITFDTDNAAFESDPMPEIREVLRRSFMALLPRTVGGAMVSPAAYPLRDTNGNTIGSVKVED